MAQIAIMKREGEIWQILFYLIGLEWSIDEIHKKKTFTVHFGTLGQISQYLNSS